MVFDFFAHDFMQRALMAGLILAVSAPVVGMFMVLHRLSLVGETLSHSTFAGLGIGVFLNIVPLWSALATTVFAALGIAKIRESARVAGDAALAVFFALGLALGIVLLSLARNVTVSITSLLFGSVLLVTWNDILATAGIAAFALTIVALFYKELIYVTLDEDLARVGGLPVRPLNYLLSVLVAILVVGSIRVVGVLLVSALLVIPALAAAQMARSLRESFLLAVGFAVVAVGVGLVISFYGAVPPGGVIVLVAVGLFFATMLLKWLLPPGPARTSTPQSS